MTQSIIVYRNPIEAAFWESGMVFPLIASLVVTVVAICVLAWVSDFICRKISFRGHVLPWTKWHYVQYPLIGLGVVIGIYTFLRLSA